MLRRTRGTLLALACALSATAPGAAGAAAPPAPLGRDVGPRAAPAAAGAPVRPVRRAGATVAHVVAPVTARRAPSAGARPVWAIPPATGWSQQSQVLLVLDEAEDATGRRWLKLELPIRPNGAAGWIPADYARLGTTPYWIEVALAARTVTVWRGGRPARRFRAVVGRPSTPTPTGLYAIWEMNRQPDPAAFLGPWAVSITALSDVLESYGGGPGRVALHGRAGASFADPLGTARSHGCVRIDNGPIAWIVRHAPRGTPVEVRR